MKQPFNPSSQHLYDHVGVHAGQGLIRSQVETQSSKGFYAELATGTLKSSENLGIGDDIPKVFKPMVLSFLQI